MNKRVLLLLGLACAAPLAACSKTDSNAGTATSAAASSPAAPPPAASSVAPASATPKMGGHGGRGGPAAMLLHAADGLGLPDDKKASLTKIEESLHTGDEAARDERKALHTELVAEVRAGKIDTTKLDPHFAALEKDVQAHEDKEADALDKLHALLDAGQRKAAVADVRTKLEAREAKMAKDAVKKDEFAKKRLQHMTSELGLDDAQQKKVDALLSKDDGKSPADMHADMKKRMDALLTAFEGDTFDVKKQEIFTAASKMARAMAGRESAFLAQVLPLLQPDQREKLAAKLDKRASHAAERPAGGLPPLFLDDPHDEHEEKP